MRLIPTIDENTNFVNTSINNFLVHANLWELMAEWMRQQTHDQKVWVQFLLLVICRSVKQASYSLSTQH